VKNPLNKFLRESGGKVTFTNLSQSIIVWSLEKYFIYLYIGIDGIHIQEVLPQSF